MAAAAFRANARIKYVMQKECPLCGSRMRLETRESVSRVPGSPQEVRSVVREWACRECDYFEEAEERESETGG
jgi:C4-type Zn-finger protein